jgi:hypothetical protein
VGERGGEKRVKRKKLRDEDTKTNHSPQNFNRPFPVVK